MNDHLKPPEDDEPAQLSTSAVDEIGAEFSGFFKRRLVMWAVRWTIGFALTCAIVSYWPQYSWLWWAAGGLALASLLLLLVGQWLVQREVVQTTSKIEEMNVAMREDHEQAKVPTD